MNLERLRKWREGRENGIILRKNLVESSNYTDVLFPDILTDPDKI